MENFLPKCLVSVEAVKHNLSVAKDLIGNSKLYFVVKSNAYGHGICLAKYVQDYCDCFCVSHIDEGTTLRFLGVTKPILMLVPLFGDNIRVALDYDITPTIDSLKTLDFALKHKKLHSVAIKVNSGMNRFGFDKLDTLYEALNLCKKSGIVVKEVFSHFYNAESLETCQKQFDLFSDFIKLYHNSFDGLCHIASSGALPHNKFCLDAVRVGLMAYGYMPYESKLNLKKAMKITAKPILLRQFGGGENALYNQTAEKGNFGLVNYGYADGFTKCCGINRCMDVSFVKTDDDGFEIMNDAYLEAKASNTSIYEVLVKCASRLEKIYIDN